MNAYDQVAYINAPIAQTHPSRLHVVARLHGLNPPPVRNCRVLELGASEGANLIGLAVALPDAQFTGIELAATPVVRGNETIAALGLTNVRLLQMNLLDVEPSFGEFDYIIVHGIYAWTPDVVRDKVLAIAGANLAPEGVAFISYNTYPGTYLRKAMREMVLYHSGDDNEDPNRRLPAARELVAPMAAARPDPDPMDAAFTAVAAEFAGSTDSSLFHDDLSSLYVPVYFHQFVSHAAAHGLRYIDDALTIDSFPRNLSDDAIASAEQMANGDWIRQLQYLDFFSARTFRQSLVTRSAKEPSRSWQTDRLEGCYATTLAREAADASFVLPDGSQLSVTQPAPVAFLRKLAAAWPRAAKIAAPETQLAAQMLRMGLIQIHAFEGAASKAGTHPSASPLVRHQIAKGINPLTTLWQEPLDFDDPPAQLIGLLNGTRTRPEIAAALQITEQQLNETLSELSYYAVLTA